jgi:hypothetical protein
VTLEQDLSSESFRVEGIGFAVDYADFLERNSVNYVEKPSREEVIRRLRTLDESVLNLLKRLEDRESS